MKYIVGRVVVLLRKAKDWRWENGGVIFNKVGKGGLPDCPLNAEAREKRRDPPRDPGKQHVQRP